MAFQEPTFDKLIPYLRAKDLEEMLVIRGVLEDMALKIQSSCGPAQG